MENLNISCVVINSMVPFATFYILIFLIGVSTSLVALWAFITSQSTKKCLNVYLINLLISDFLIMIALPVKIAIDLGSESQSLFIFHCQVSGPLIYINLYASIIFLSFVSVQRYLQITQSSKLLRLQEVGFALLMSAVVWFLVLFINVPNMAIPIKAEIPNKLGLKCSDLKTEVGKHWHALSVFLGMAIFFNASVAVLLSNGLVLKQLWRRHESDPQDQAIARHAFRNIGLVTLAYMICFVPYHAVRVPYTFTQIELINNCNLQKSLYLAKESTLLLSILHLCFDPLLYFFICRSVRHQITKAFSKRHSDPNTDQKCRKGTRNQVQRVMD